MIPLITLERHFIDYSQRGANKVERQKERQKLYFFLCVLCDLCGKRRQNLAVILLCLLPLKPERICDHAYGREGHGAGCDDRT